MRPVTRWVIAILIAVILLVVFVPVYRIGFGLGGMGTDSCSMPNAAFLWLEVLWPIALLATALVPAIFIVRRIRWRWVWVSLGIGLVMSTCCYLSWWFPLLTLMCK